MMLSEQITQQARNSGSLLDNIDAVRNWRAVLLLLATLMLATLVLVAGAAVVGGALAQVNDIEGRMRLAGIWGSLVSLLALAVAFYGLNAVGMMMMDEAQGYPSRPIGAAVMSSLATSHRLILVLLIVGAIYLVAWLAFAAVLSVCKIPGVGPLLYAFVFPVGVVVSGMAIVAVPTVIFPLSAPAIWGGADTMACVSQLLAIARKRLLLVLIMMMAVGLIAVVVGALISVVLSSGTLFTGLQSAAVLGGNEFGGSSGMASGFTGLVLLLGGMIAGADVASGLSGYPAAAMAGGGMLYAAALTLPGLVYLRGASSVYLRAIDGLDLSAERAALNERLAAAKAKAREMQAQAQATAQQYAQRAQAPAPGVPAASAAVAPVAAVAAVTPVSVAGCPACGTAIVPGDMFCASCGRRLG